MAHIKPSIFRNIFLGIEKVVNTFSISDKIFQKMINYCVPFGRDGNFAPSRLTRPSPASPRAGFPRPTKVVGWGWGKILDPHHGAGRGWVYTF